MNYKKLLKFFRETSKLKKLKRSGWIVSGVENSESIADHCFMTILMVLILGKKKNIDLNKALKMAIIHDIAECQIGDIITWKNYQKTKPEKRDIEEKAMKNILSSLGDEGNEYFEIWEEFEEEKSPEAKFVKAIDKLEMILQALKYENEEKNLNELIETFFEGNDIEFITNTDEDLSEMIKLIISLRKKK